LGRNGDQDCDPASLKDFALATTPFFSRSLEDLHQDIVLTGRTITGLWRPSLSGDVVKRPILVHSVTHPLSEPWNLIVFLRQLFDRYINASHAEHSDLDGL
jgi:hypothetical protein